MQSVIAQFVLPALGSLALLLFSAFFARLLPGIPELTQRASDWARLQASHLQNQFAAGLAQRAISVVTTIVLRFEAVEIDALKQRLDSGGITLAQLPELLKDLERRAVEEAKAQFTAEAILHDLVGIFGGGNLTGIELWISNLVKAVVQTLPPSGLQTRVPAGVQAPSGEQLAAIAARLNPVSIPAPSSVKLEQGAATSP